ncbi:MAG TPA: zinc ABC transporter substrate-binding protein [Gaiella sp.]|nr:zinc ABC transporter substrate-binding protein [Gaiella sp.]
MCVLLVTLATVGCGGDEDTEPEIVAAFYPLAYAASQVAPEGMAVADLTPAGAEPHDLELTPGHVARLRDATHVVYAGGGFQPGLEDALEDRPALDVLTAVPTLRDAEGEAVDPHVWLDPVRYAGVARAIAVELGDPSAAVRFVVRLEALDAELRRGLARCERREIVTSHAAFGYLADRYRLVQVPLVGLSPEAEPSARDIERLADEVRATGATTVFFERLVSPRLAETVAREAGVRTAVLDPLEGLTQEQLDAGVDYFDVMRDNLTALRGALGCT